MPVTAIIADDEPVLRQHLRDLLNKEWPALNIVGMAEDGNKAIQLAQKIRPDIIFLDIRMPGKSGLEAAAAINSFCRIVFVTAYDEYGVEAFEKQAIDYLLKPVTNDRLAQTIARLQNDLDNTLTLSDQILEELRQKLDLPASPEQYLQWLKIGQGNGIQLTNVKEVLYFQAADKYTRIITESGEELIRTSIKELAASLNPEQFWRIHRATIVNVSRIKSASRSFTGRYLVHLTGHVDILTASRTYGHLFKQM